MRGDCMILHTPLLFENNFWNYKGELSDGLYALQDKGGTVTFCEVFGEDVLDPESKRVERKKSQLDRLIKSGLVRYARIPTEEMWYE